MNLTNEEIEIVNILFNSIFTLKLKEEILLESDSSLYIDFALNGKNAEKINTLFDSAFELEHKTDIIVAFYKKYGYTFKDIHELIENRHLLIFNYYDSSWRKKNNRKFKA